MLLSHVCYRVSAAACAMIIPFAVNGARIIRVLDPPWGTFTWITKRSAKWEKECGGLLDWTCFKGLGPKVWCECSYRDRKTRSTMLCGRAWDCARSCVCVTAAEIKIESWFIFNFQCESGIEWAWVSTCARFWETCFRIFLFGKWYFEHQCVCACVHACTRVRARVRACLCACTYACGGLLRALWGRKLWWCR